MDDYVYVALMKRWQPGGAITVTFDQVWHEFKSVEDLRAAINEVLRTSEVHISRSIRDVLGLLTWSEYDNLEFEKGKVLPAPRLRIRLSDQDPS